MGQDKTRAMLAGLEFNQNGGLPLAQRVAGALGALIEKGKLEPGQKLPPTRELADLMGVSCQVAHDALSLMVERNLLRRKPRLGTMVLDRPHGHSCALLAVVADWLPLRSNFGWLVMQEFVRRADARGLHHREYVTLRSREEGPELPRSLREDLRSERIDVLFLSAIHPSTVRRRMPSVSVPLVLMEAHLGVGSVLGEAAQWLKDAGCESVGFLLHGDNEEMEEEMRRFCEAAGLSLPAEWVMGGLRSSTEHGRQLLHYFYPEGEAGPDGLVILDDLVAYGFSEEARETGRGPDPARVVVQENRGSSLPLPEESPRIQLDWGTVVEGALDRFQAEEEVESVDAKEAAFRFVTPEQETPNRTG